MESCDNNIHAASEGAQNKKVRVRVFSRGTRLKNKLQSPPQADRHRKPTYAVAKRLGRQMGAAHRKCTRVGPNCQELLGGAKKLKKLFARKKWPIRPGLQISHHSNFVRSTLKHARRQPQKLNCLRKGPGRNLEKG